MYLMTGHSVSDYENRNVAQMVLNAIDWALWHGSGSVDTY